LLYDFLNDAGYDVDTAVDGRQGQLLFDLVRQDLLILDLVMPRMSGWTLAERIAEIDAHVPIVALTGFGANLEAEAERRGIFLVHKPVNLGVLLAVIRELLPGNREL
jgi:DNA-binding response OmpR family regulator